MPVPRSATTLLLLLGICANPPDAAAQTTLTVFAAASLTEAFTALGRRFEADHPGVSVSFNFAGSQILATQIEQGAGADVFASADRRWMAYLGERSRLSGEPVIFGRNRLVVLIPRTNPGLISKLEDLARPGVKLVLAGAQVPAGAYSRQALKQLDSAAGFPPDFSRRVLANVVSEEENVRAVAAKVQLREADAGIVYRTDVSTGVAAQVRQFDLPACCNPIAEYPIAAVSGGQTELAAEFIALVRSSDGQRILVERGFLAPAGAAP
jgi:molybdate transport system substrate-binding protein